MDTDTRAELLKLIGDYALVSISHGMATGKNIWAESESIRAEGLMQMQETNEKSSELFNKICKIIWK